jgi:hypothetical protein
MLLWEDGIARKLDIRVEPGQGPDGPDDVRDLSVLATSGLASGAAEGEER